MSCIMPRVVFTPNLERHIAAPPKDAEGATVRQVLESVFADNPRLKGYVLDDQGRLREHMSVFVDGHAVRDRVGLSDPVPEDSEVYVLQALSGG